MKFRLFTVPSCTIIFWPEMYEVKIVFDIVILKIKSDFKSNRRKLIV